MQTDSLVALYDIRPGNGAGQFLQNRSPHGAILPTACDEKVDWRTITIYELPVITTTTTNIISIAAAAAAAASPLDSLALNKSFAYSLLYE